jgi:hypothetical protein
MIECQRTARLVEDLSRAKVAHWQECADDGWLSQFRRRGGTKDVPNADLRGIAEHTTGLSTFLNIRHRTLDPNDGNVSAD